MRVLDVGSGGVNMAKQIWADAEVITLDAFPEANPDVLMDLTSDEFQAWMPERFDTIWMSHVLEHLTLEQGQGVMAKLADLLVPGGAIHIRVPSLEWAAEQIMLERKNPVVTFHIYGAQSNEYQLHKWGFTMRSLRSLCHVVGLTTPRARSQMYQIRYNGEEYDAQEHYVVGVKSSGGTTDE